MRSQLKLLHRRKQTYPVHNEDSGAWRRIAIVIACLGLSCAFGICSSLLSSQSNAATQLAKPQKPVEASKTLTDAQLARMSPDELATNIFEHHGCNNCHTLGKNGKLGFTERGKEVGKNFVGCISLLTSMNVIAQENEQYRTVEEREKAAKFEEFGCTTCHRITPGKLGLTPYGVKLKSMHMACTDVEKILTTKEGK